MNDYLIVKFENGKEFILVDRIQQNNKIYFLVLKSLELKNSFEENFETYKYNEDTNSLDHIRDIEEYNLIFSIFETRLEKQGEILSFQKNLQKMKIVYIDNYNYTLEDEKGFRIIKNLDFKNNIKPRVNDYIYMSEKTVKEKNIFVYGEIYNLLKITEDEIIKLEGENYEYFLQRYYG